MDAALSQQLTNHNKCLLIIAFSVTCHNNMVLFCVRFEPSDLLASYKLADQVKSLVNNFQVQVKSRVISLNSKSSCKKMGNSCPTQIQLQSAHTTRVNRSGHFFKNYLNNC